MKIFGKVLNAILFVFVFAAASAQNSLVINEVMVNNETNNIDGYGNRSPWIEIYNNSGSTVNIGGYYLSNDPNDLKKYPIMKGDKNTIIGPRQFIVFRADGNDFHGTLYTNFKLDPNDENTVYLSDPNGKPIDEVTVPKTSLMADVSYGRMPDGDSKFENFTKPTPNINNLYVNRDEANIKFKNNDPYGVAMSATAILVVFLSLILMYYVFKYSSKLYLKKFGHKKPAAASETKTKANQANDDEGISGETVAAIAAAIHQMQNNSHDIENAILTIERHVANYSPWSSKIYGLKQTPQLKNK